MKDRETKIIMAEVVFLIIILLIVKICGMMDEMF
jgi:hypothetical protein